MKKYIKSSEEWEEWDGVFTPEFIMEYSDIEDEDEAQRLSDYLYEHEYDSGFSTPEEFLETFDLDELYDDMINEQ